MPITNKLTKTRPNAYSPSDLALYDNIPATLPLPTTQVTPSTLTSPSLGGAALSDKVSIECRFLHDVSRWGKLIYKSGNLCAGILHMEISFRGLAGRALKSATVRVILDGENEILERYRKVVGVRSKPGEGGVEIREIGPVSIVGTPYGIASKAHFAVNPQVDVAEMANFSAIEASVEKEWKKHYRWVFEGSAAPHKPSRSGTVNRVEWSLLENTKEGQPSHGNRFRTAFVFANDGQPFIMRLEVEGTLRGRHRVKAALKFGGEARSRGKEAMQPTTLIRGFEGERDRLNGLARRLNLEMNRANNAVDYNRRKDGRGGDVDVEEDESGQDEEETLVDEEASSKPAEKDPEEGTETVEPTSFVELARLIAESGAKFEDGEGKKPSKDIKAEDIPLADPPAMKTEEETVLLLRALVQIWRELLGRIQKLLVLGFLASVI
ncbi:hypothetical protein QBC47DRAFT_385053 [Echria macrotheca]|uniref:Uncharacterized protein n=1 Tax=Echria macrotheca TaxID=438768 RepID=A0AAJ0FA63_9PEZI|nr:hypothetical protein QBC47DRAFT_385053 [Echria macrotheca]